MPWPWESEFWRLGAPPADGADGGRDGWQIDASFADARGRFYCFRGARTISAHIAVGMSGRFGRNVDAVERLCAGIAENANTGSALLAVVSGRTPALVWDRWRALGEAFPGVEWTRVDAAVRLEGDVVYLFCGAEFIGYDLKTMSVRRGYPRPIEGQWQGLWSGDIDAAVNPGRGKAFFFKHGECARYDIARQCVERGFPRAIGEVFPGLSWRSLDSVLSPGRAGEVVFFREHDALVYRDPEAARQLALSEAEARARVESVLNGDATELVESLNRARRDDRSRGVSRTDVFESALVEVRRHAELASMAASFAATAARYSEEAIARLGVADLSGVEEPEALEALEPYASSSGSYKRPPALLEEEDVVEIEPDEIEVDLDGLDELSEGVSAGTG